MELTIGRIAIVVVGLLLLVVERGRSRAGEGAFRPLSASAKAAPPSAAAVGLLVLSCVQMALLVALFLNHVAFPLSLEIMEGPVLQHFARVADGQAVYPAPTAEYIALAYNPLYYYLALPAGWLFGVNLFTLRLVAILGVMGSAAVLYAAVRRETGSRGWGLLALGLFAAAYHAMDAYLDTAHADSWLLFAALLGTYWLERSRSFWGELGALLILVAGFWIKQHGALFVVGGVLFLSWRTYRTRGNAGAGRIIAYWLLAALLGPGLYVALGPSLFGDSFHYFTWEIPRTWSTFNTATIARLGLFILGNYAFLAVSGGLFALWQLVARQQRLTAWAVQFFFAALTGLLGALDGGSSNNVFIPMGMWFLLLGLLGCWQVFARMTAWGRRALVVLALYASFALLLYDPRPLWVPASAPDSYDDFTALLQNLDGPIYSPDIGYMACDCGLYPHAHWVALEDLVRGPGNDTRDHPLIMEMLAPVAQPDSAAYILTYRPLEARPYLAFLAEDYVLETDFGERFQPLKTIPHRWDIGYPRYLYRYDPARSEPNQQR